MKINIKHMYLIDPPSDDSRIEKSTPPDDYDNTNMPKKDS